MVSSHGRPTEHHKAPKHLPSRKGGAAANAEPWLGLLDCQGLGVAFLKHSWGTGCLRRQSSRAALLPAGEPRGRSRSGQTHPTPSDLRGDVCFLLPQLWGFLWSRGLGSQKRFLWGCNNGCVPPSSTAALHSFQGILLAKSSHPPFLLSSLKSDPQKSIFQGTQNNSNHVLSSDSKS